MPKPSTYTGSIGPMSCFSYLRLSAENRIRILEQEDREGQEVWSEMPTMINGRPGTVMACRKWGVIAIGGQLLALDQYPLQHLERIDTEQSGAP